MWLIFFPSNIFVIFSSFLICVGYVKMMEFLSWHGFYLLVYNGSKFLFFLASQIVFVISRNSGWPPLALRTLAIRDTCHATVAIRRQLPFGHLPFGDTCPSDSCHSKTLALQTVAIRDTCHSETFHSETYIFRKRFVIDS